jgi:hypothetical protein
MDRKHALKETAHVAAPVAPKPLGVNVFTAPGKVMVGKMKAIIAAAGLTDKGYRVFFDGL